jgi:hypothetical protein
MRFIIILFYYLMKTDQMLQKLTVFCILYIRVEPCVGGEGSTRRRLGSSWSSEAQNGVEEVHPGAAEAHYGTVKANPGAEEAHHGAV